VAKLLIFVPLCGIAEVELADGGDATACAAKAQQAMEDCRGTAVLLPAGVTVTIHQSPVMFVNTGGPQQEPPSWGKFPGSGGN
jgi:hypothetical protein